MGECAHWRVDSIHRFDSSHPLINVELLGGDLLLPDERGRLELRVANILDHLGRETQLEQILPSNQLRK